MGFAYTAPGDGLTVVRGAYGIFYLPTNTALGKTPFTTGPWSRTYSYSSLDSGVTFDRPFRFAGTDVNTPSTVPINDGNWHHVAYVFDQAPGATVSVYIDGLLDTVAPVNFAAWSWSELQIEIGLSWDPWWRVFNGELDDIRFYKRQLSLTEVQQAVQKTFAAFSVSTFTMPLKTV